MAVLQGPEDLSVYCERCNGSIARYERSNGIARSGRPQYISVY